MVRALDSATLLQVWDESHGLHPVRRSLMLLYVAARDVCTDWASTPIGRRDEALLNLYAALFGANMETVTHCPQCGERLESQFSANDIGVPSPENANDAQLNLRHGSWQISFRLPHSEDLLHVLNCCVDVEQAQRALLARCLIEAKHGRKGCEAAKLPAEVVAALMQEMSRQDPNADVSMRMSCAVCGHAWEIAFDIVSFLWNAVEDWAQHTLAEIHLLARAYGWSESEILSLTPMRRRHYVDMVRA